MNVIWKNRNVSVTAVVGLYESLVTSAVTVQNCGLGRAKEKLEFTRCWFW